MIRIDAYSLNRLYRPGYLSCRVAAPKEARGPTCSTIHKNAGGTYNRKDDRAIWKQLALASPVDVFRTRFFPRHGVDRAPHLPTIKGLKDTVHSTVHKSPGQDIASILDLQLRECLAPRHLHRIITVALQQSSCKDLLSGLAWNEYRVMEQTAVARTAARMLEAINSIAIRFDDAGIIISPDLAWHGLRAAAFSYNPAGMRHWLEHFHRHGLQLSQPQGSELLVGLCRAYRYLASEGQTPRSKTVNLQMTQILLGSNNSDGSPSNHIGQVFPSQSSLPKEWSIMLANTQNLDALWNIWISQKDYWSTQLSQEDYVYKRLHILRQVLRADCSDSIEKAWQIVNETKLTGAELKRGSTKYRVLTALVSHPEYAKVWDTDFQQVLLEVLTARLEEIEQMMRIEWKATEDGGFHIYSSSTWQDALSLTEDGNQAALPISIDRATMSNP